MSRIRIALLCVSGALICGVALPALAANPGDVIITEIMYNPASNETAPAITEWVEVYNTTGSPIDLTGWYIADEDGRSGDFESFTLPAHGVAVVICKGTDAKPLTKADFTAAWGVPASQLIQPTATNDASGPRPTSGSGGNLPQGGLGGSGLANSPTNDGNDANDLVNTPFDPTSPCAYYQPLCVSGPPDNEVTLLVDNTNHVIDKVNYGAGGSTAPNIWPPATNGPSIYLKPGFLNATDNDAGTSWASSVVGTGGARQNTPTAIFSGPDIGSPGFVDDGSNIPPVALSMSYPTGKGVEIVVALDVTDSDGPEPLTVEISTLPAHGVVKDGGIAVATVPHTVTGIVTYQSTGEYVGMDSFTFVGRNPLPQVSMPGTISLYIQNDTVVITEIAYNPKSADGTDEWEWVEIYNAGTSTVTLGGIGTSFPLAKPANLGSAQINAGQVLILARDANGNPPAHTQQDFLDLWGLQAAQVVFVPFADWSALVNSGGASVYLTDSSGGLLDVVAYGVSNPWPSSTNGPSIYVKNGLTNTLDNDAGGNWALSVYTSPIPTDGAKQTPNGDIGSPMFVPGITVGNQPPVAVGQTVWTARNGSWDIYLQGADDGLPDPPKQLDFVIDTLPANGQLIDVNDSNHVITSGELPYTVKAQKNLVRYVNSGACGDTSFTFHTSDTELTSNTATQTIIVQCGDLVITEVMYNPASDETTPKVTEWIEVYNTTDIAINATGWYITKGTNGAANRSGDWPSTAIIPAHGVAVIVPPGSGARTMDPAQFRAAWDGYDVPIIIVPTATNDSAAGELAASGLANSPAYPGEMLRIIDLSGRVQDIVSYRDGSGWPSATGESSIYLKSGNYTAGDNDSGANWGNSRSCAGGAYGCKVTGAWDKTDFGSPGYLEGKTCGSNNVPPTPLWRRVGIMMNTPPLVPLTYCDDGNPVAGPVTFTITAMPAPDPALPAHGTLTDPANNHVIVESDLPYTLLNHGNQVRYTPNPDYTSAFGGPDGKTDTGDYFSFAVNDGEKDSRADGHIALVVQKGQLILSEIMYDPAHLNANPVTGDSDWEWLEVTNVSGSDVTLAGVTDTIGEPDSLFFVGASIPAGATRVIAPDNSGRTQQEFLDAWGLDSSSVIFVYGWETLVNTGNRLQLIDDTGALQDEVYYGGSTSGPWPASNNQSSIYVRYGKLGAIDNDQGVNWALSEVGVDNAVASSTTPSEVGSPAALPTTPCAVPTVVSITPSRGSPGQSLAGVSIVGQNFRAGATVRFTRPGQADIVPSDVAVIDANHITCDVVLLSCVAEGRWNVVVTTECGSATLAEGFEVGAACTAPTVDSITPNAGVQDYAEIRVHPPYDGVSAATGPVHVTITGTGFVSGATVKLVQAGKDDLVATNVVVVDANTITADVDLGGAAPGALDGDWDVVVTTCASGTKPAAFTVSMCFSPREDIDGDGDVDLADFGTFQACFNGPNRPYKGSVDQRKCACLDLGDNPVVADVDLADFNKFQSCFNGPNRAAKQPACDLANQP